MEARKCPSDPIMLHYFRSKEIYDFKFQYYRSQLSSMKSLIDRLGLDFELTGHGGCVNCIEWNSKGTILASGSDDFHVMLWDPFTRKRLASIDTGHIGNIFSVKFMPQSMDGLVASGAGDGRIKVHCVEKASDPSYEPGFQCSCHAARVKRLATVPDVPFMLWSAAEDGTVMEYDMRAPHNCSHGPSNILINLLSHSGKQTEIKSISINPVRPELLAIGANDPYVRLYDRRKIKHTSIQYSPERPSTAWARQSYFVAMSASSEANRTAIPTDCVQYFVPGHLPRKLEEYKRRYRSLAATYVTFDPTGRYLLANIGGEHIYLYDICTPKQPFSELPELGTEESNHVALPSELEQLKFKANAAFHQQQFTTAIGLYGKALLKAPRTAVLYSNRAAAFLRRNWDGDAYAALKDCCSALKLDPGQLKAFHRLVRCLLDLGHPLLAEKALKLLKENQPSQAGNSFVVSLEKEIQKALAKHSSSVRETTGDGDEVPGDERTPAISAQEQIWRSQAWDFTSRYCGHCNTTTDIKEANFFGNDGQYILAGSDDGCFFIWDRQSGVVERVLRGDEAIVNCLQPHPSICLLATSGIDSVVRLWAPLAQEPRSHDRVGSVVTDLDSVAKSNQRRMNADPFEMLLMNMVSDAGNDHGMPDITVRRRPAPSPGDDGEESDADAAIQCRQS